MWALCAVRAIWTADVDKTNTDKMDTDGERIDMVDRQTRLVKWDEAANQVGLVLLARRRLALRWLNRLFYLGAHFDFPHHCFCRWANSLFVASGSVADEVCALRPLRCQVELGVLVFVFLEPSILDGPGVVVWSSFEFFFC
jgi:hypothetical protein